MKFLAIALLALSFNSFAGTESTYAKASPLAKKQLKKYLIADGYITTGEDPVSALDDDSLDVQVVGCSNGKYYDYIKVYSGDTEHGPLFVSGSLKLVGRNSDGDFALNTKDPKKKAYINCEEYVGH